MKTQTLRQLDKKSIEQALRYVDGEWHRLKAYCPTDRGTLIGLPHPYVVPSSEANNGFIYRELYYWDTYFVLQAMLLNGQVNEAREHVDNLILLFQRFGVIPNASRFYMLSRSQPPLLTSMIWDVYERTHEDSWLEWAISQAEKEYSIVWTAHQQPHNRQVFQGLSRYYDINVLHSLAEAESGWDYTSRFHDRCLDFVPIDLNSFLFKYEADFARYGEHIGDHERANMWRERAQVRKDTINKYMWHEDNGFYFDFDFVHQQQSNVYSLAAYAPMFMGVAEHHQAQRLVENLHNFETNFGLSTTPPQYGIVEQKQWAAPNGWAPLHFIAYVGLKRYGYNAEAERIARKWLQLNLEVFKRTGKFYEKYNVVDGNEQALEGVYPMQIGFAWTNAVFAYFAHELKLDS